MRATMRYRSDELGLVSMYTVLLFAILYLVDGALTLIRSLVRSCPTSTFLNTDDDNSHKYVLHLFTIYSVQFLCESRKNQ